MAEFKGMGPEAKTERLPIESFRPAFAEFDLQTEGGILIDDKGRAYEVSHPTWKEPGQEDPAKRTRALNFWQDETGRFEYIPDQEWDSYAPTFGSENESLVRHGSTPYQSTQDGETLLFPDGYRAKMKHHHMRYDPEASKDMLEYKTDLAYGWREHKTNRIETAVRHARAMREHRLTSPPLTVRPETLTEDDVTEQWFVQLMDAKMNLREFACLSGQINAQMRSLEAGLYAMGEYQGDQAIFSLITAGGPIRKSFDTTLREHYHDDYKNPDGSLVLPEHDYIRYLMSRKPNLTPYDWRELARVYGSQSAGAWAEVPPVDADEFLRRGDEQLRRGKTISITRLMGWHTDRMRVDHNAAEFCNLGAAINLYKTNAAEEIVTKYYVAKQLEQVEMQREAQKEWPETWREELAAAVRRQHEHSIERGQVNNFFMSISGKETNFLAPEEGTATPQELLEDIMNFTDKYGPEPISREAREEALATLQTPPPLETFASYEDVFWYFYSPRSAMNATEALRYARALAPADMSDSELIDMFEEYHYMHVLHVQAEWESAA